MPRPSPASLALPLFACVALAARLLLIATWGSATPISDQWSQEGGLYNDFLTGHLDLSRLLASHYEHRFVLTRLLDLLELLLNHGVWNPLLQMVVNSGLAVAALVLLLALLRPACPPGRWPWLLAFALALAVLPYNDENTLNGFQSQIYFSLLFSTAFLYLLSQAPALGTRWWLGLGCGLLAWLSHGAGTGTLVAATVFLLWRGGGGRERVGLMLVAGLTLLAIATTPAAEAEHAVMMVAGVPREIVFTPRATTPGEFLLALWRIASWPSPWLAPLFYLPLCRRLWQLWRQAPRPGSADAFVLALLLWVVAMLVMMAYGRARAPLLSRYTDFYALGLLTSFFCLVRGGQRRAGEAVRISPWLAAAWAVLVLAFLLRYTSVELGALQGLYQPQLEAQGRDIRAYLDSGNAAWLARNEYPELPAIPTAADLHHLLSYPALRSTLPPPIVPDNELRQAGWVRLLLANLRPLALLLLTGAMGLLLWSWPRSRPNTS